MEDRDVMCLPIGVYKYSGLVFPVVADDAMHVTSKQVRGRADAIYRRYTLTLGTARTNSFNPMTSWENIQIVKL